MASSFDLKKVIADERNRDRQKKRPRQHDGHGGGEDLAHKDKAPRAHHDRELRLPPQAGRRGGDFDKQKDARQQAEEEVRALGDAGTYHDRAAERRRALELEEQAEASKAPPPWAKGLDFDLLRRTRELGDLPTPVEVLLQPKYSSAAASTATSSSSIPAKPRDVEEMAKRLSGFLADQVRSTYIFDVNDFDMLTEARIVPASQNPCQFQVPQLMIFTREDCELVKQAMRRHARTAETKSGGVDEDEEDLFEGVGSYEQHGSGAATNSLEAARHALEKTVRARDLVVDSDVSEDESNNNINLDQVPEPQHHVVQEYEPASEVSFVDLDLEELYAFRARVVEAISMVVAVNSEV